MQFDLQISENLNRLDPRANWQITPKTMFAHEPVLCYIPTRMENLQWPMYAPFGNQHQPISSVTNVPSGTLRPMVEVKNSDNIPKNTETVSVIKGQTLLILKLL